MSVEASDQFDPVEAARVLVGDAVALHGAGQLTEALEVYELILSRLGEHLTARELAGCQMNRAGCLAGIGSLHQALAGFDSALPLLREYGLPSDVAKCLMNGALCQQELGHREEALDRYAEALPLSRAHGLPADVAICLMNRAGCQQELGRYSAALEEYEEAVPLLREHGLPADVAICLMNRANCLREVGQWEEALAGYEEAVPLYTANGLSADVAIFLMNRAGCLQELRRPETALQGYEEALPLLREHGLPADVAICLMNRATCLDDLERFDDALAEYEEALPLLREHGLSADLAICQMNRAESLRRLGRYESAVAGLEAALPLLRAHGVPVDLARCLMNRALCLAGLGHLEEALAGYEEALPLFTAHGLPTDLAGCLVNRATCLVGLGLQEEALAALDDSFAAEDRASVLLQDPTYRTLAREQTADRYRVATQLALDQAQPERAWGYVQRGKGRTLLDLLQVRGQQTALDRQELLLVQQQQAGQVDDETFATNMRHIGDQREAHRKARLGRDPWIPLPLADVVEALRPGEVLLDAFTSYSKGTVVLFLLRHGQPMVAWTRIIDGEALTPLVERWQEARSRWTAAKKALAWNAGIAAEPDSTVKAYRQREIIAGDHEATLRETDATERQLLAELGALIFGPVLEQLEETDTTLIVSPDGLLHRIPLTALTIPDKAGEQHLASDRITLQLVPSATTLAILRKPDSPRSTWPAALLAAAPFATDGPDGTRSKRLIPTASTGLGSRLRSLWQRTPDRDRQVLVPPGAIVAANVPQPSVVRNLVRTGDTPGPLPHSGPEIEAVAALLTSIEGDTPPVVLKQQAATRSRVETHLPAARVLHLATHGGALKPGETVLDYRIFLADGTAIQVKELYDGTVSLQDVFLVNLSACSLGQVMQQGGEASGFVQGFLQAGAGVVLAPLWDVYDYPTMLLMKRFYEELTGEERPSIAEAWRRAARWLRTATPYSHPVYWAGFVPSGDGSLRLTA